MGDLESLMLAWLADGTPDQRRHAAYRIAAGFDAPPAPAPDAGPPATPAPARCPYLDSCRCHGPVPVCLHTLHGPALGEPADEKGSIVYRVDEAACAACPLGPSTSVT